MVVSIGRLQRTGNRDLLEKPPEKKQNAIIGKQIAKAKATMVTMTLEAIITMTMEPRSTKIKLLRFSKIKHILI
jgi:hypothetical protein